MTLEDIENNLRTINEELDEIIVGTHFDEIQWKEDVSVIVDNILEDEDVKNILLEGTANERKQYLYAIKEGIQQAIEALKNQIKDLNDSGMFDKASAFEDVTLQSEKVADTVLKLEAIENDQEEFVFSDEERIEDLENKIYYLNIVAEMQNGMEQLEGEIILAADEKLEDKAIDLSSDMEINFEKYEEKINLIAELRESKEDFYNCFKEVKELCDKDLINMSNSEHVTKVYKLVEYARIIDQVDSFESRDPKKLHLGEPQYKTKDGKDIKSNKAVKNWIGNMNTNFNDDDKSKKMYLESEFLDYREKFVKDSFIEQYKNSTVHKVFTPEMYQKVLQENDFDVEELKYNILDLSERLKKYKVLSEKSPEELLEYKNQAEKLLKYYKTVSKGFNNITINGKIKQLETELTDIDKKYDVVDEILQLDDEDEFKKELESKSIILAGERPTDKWYHKFARFITFGIYKTPEQKYEIKLYGKKADIIGEIIKENKTTMDEAIKNIEYDKNTYKQIAREKIYNEKNEKPEEKKFDKKEVMEKREKSRQPLTR